LKKRLHNQTNPSAKRIGLIGVILAPGGEAFYPDSSLTSDIEKTMVESVVSSTRPNNPNRFSLDKLKMNKYKLESFKRLTTNWNGYDGQQISPSLIDLTINLITGLDYQPKIFPTGRGSIQIEYQQAGNYIEIEITENENYVFSIKNSEEKSFEISFDKIPVILNEFFA
jgi:hypothetical protein